MYRRRLCSSFAEFMFFFFFAYVLANIFLLRATRYWGANSHLFRLLGYHRAGLSYALDVDESWISESEIEQVCSWAGLDLYEQRKVH
ncbi:hypothetical protein ACSBR2_038430 [Camellia fascicularis]